MRETTSRAVRATEGCLPRVRSQRLLIPRHLLSGRGAAALLSATRQQVRRRAAKLVTDSGMDMRSTAVSLRHLRSAPILAGRARAMALFAQPCRCQALTDKVEPRRS